MDDRKFTDPRKAGPDHEYETRSGERATQVTFFGTTSDHPIVAVINGGMQFFTTEGKFCSNGRSLPSDLVDKPMVIEGWLNIYNDGSAAVHATRANADVCSGTSRSACIPIKYTKGEGL